MASRNKRNPSDLANAQYLTLDFRPISQKASNLQTKLQEIIFADDAKPRRRGRPPDVTAIANAALLIVAEVLDVAKGNLERTVHHGLSPSKFTGKEVSYRHFKAAMLGLQNYEFLVEIAKGSYGHKSLFTDAENPGPTWGHNTRWHPTKKLIDLCNSFEITHQNIDDHFEVKLPKEPIQLRQSKGGSWQNRTRGRMVKFSVTLVTKRLVEEINEINEFLKGVKLTGASHRGYRRIYNQGDNPETYKWDKGGRLYGSGSEDNYLTIKKEKRKKMLIDGEATIQIDVRASYLTIFHAMHGLNLSLDKDPYSITGLPREIVKRWVVMAFGAGKPPTRWPSKVVHEFRERTGKELGKVHNLKSITPKVLEAFPVLKKLKAGGIDCFDLMNRESNAIVAAILRLLREDRVPSFSVHDCLIVKKKDKELATRVLEQEYFKATGATPCLKVS